MKTVDFSETIAACDLKGGSYKQLIDLIIIIIIIIIIDFILRG